MLPRFTIRQLMLAMVAIGMLFAILGWAARGSFLAAGLAIAIIGLFIPFGCYAVVYWLSWRLFGHEKKSTIDKPVD